MHTATFFITSRIAGSKHLLQNASFAELLVNVLENYRGRGEFQLHAFAVMPDHLHILLTHKFDGTLERAVQLVKGGFSYRLRKEFGYQGNVWQSGYNDRRVRNAEECAAIVRYIHQNPVAKYLCKTAGDYPFSSAHQR